MPPQTQTFPCPFCGRRMGVGVELLGKHVRCPHCKQVVLAPAGAGASAPPRPAAPKPAPASENPFAFDLGPPPPAPPPAAAPKPPEPSAPVFRRPRREGADSILTGPEESEDDVFGSEGRKPLRVPRPPDPAPPRPAAEELPPTEPLTRAPASPGAGEPGPADLLASEPESPAPPRRAERTPSQATQARPEVPPVGPVPTLVVSGLVPTTEATPSTVSSPPPPAAPSRPVPAAPVPSQPAATAPANPWAGLDAMAAPPASAPVAPVPAVVPVPIAPAAPGRVEDLPEEEPRPAAGAPRTRATVASGGVPRVAVYALAAYALLMTGLAVYGLVFRSPPLPPDHPLSTIPDDFGEFPAADRKKVSASRVPLDGELPANQKAAIGGKIELGQLVIEPVGVEKRALTLVRESGEERRPVGVGDGLVLQLKVTNTSQDVAIFPLDPAFVRRDLGSDKPATRVVVGRETFVGGPISWPFGKVLTREYEQAQEAENQPLGPGQTRDYYVCSVADPRLAVAVRHAKEPVLWRVQVRRGVIEFRGKDVPVTAIIGVEFRGGEVRGL